MRRGPGLGRSHLGESKRRERDAVSWPAALEARIASGELRPGGRRPADRAFQEDFGVARSVIRQALAGLAGDGLVVSAYPRGYTVLGPRIPWISRLRLLRDEPWRTVIGNVDEAQANERVAAALGIPPR